MTDLFNIELEENVLGSILIDSDAIIKVADIIKPADFHRPRNRTVFDAMLSLYYKAEPISELTVAHELAASKKLEDAGGAGYLTHMVANVATSVYVEHYAKTLKELALKRSLKRCSKEIEALADTEDVAKAYADALGVILRAKQDTDDDYYMTPKQQAQYAVDRYSKLMSAIDDPIIPFGLRCLDELGGMEGGDIIIIGGAPGEGKTTMAAQMAAYVAKHYGTVLFASLEMSKGQMTDRNVARLIKESLIKIRTFHRDPKTKDEVYERICGSIGPLSEERVHLYYPPMCTIPMLYAMARKVQSREGLKLLVIDYVQLMRDTDGGKSENERLTNISRGVKVLARELDVPIISVSRMSRNKEHGNLERMYGSGAFSYDPDWVFIIERDKDEDGKFLDTGKLIIAKQRQGGFKDVSQQMRFDKLNQKLEEV